MSKHPLSEAEVDALVDDIQDRLGDSTARKYGRRGVLAALGVAALGTGSASAQASGTVGTSSSPVDVFGYDVDASNSFTDPAGVTHSGELADISDVGASGQWQEVNSGSNIEPIDGETIGTGSEDVDVGTVSTDKASVSGISGQFVHNALAEGYVVALHSDESSSWLVDPSTDSNPINTAMDLVADAADAAGLPVEQRGAVYLPAHTISHANPVTPYNFVTVKTPLGTCQIQPPVDTDGVVWDIANDPYNSYSYFRVDWSDARVVIRGQGTATSTAATGWVETTGHWRSHFAHIDVSEWSVPAGEHLWHAESSASTFETIYEYVRVNGDAGNSDGMIQYDGGGALKRFGIVAANAQTGLSGTVFPVINSSIFGGTIDMMNLGGDGLAQAFQDTGPVHIKMINYEPGAPQPSAPTSVFRVNGSSTFGRCEHIWLRKSATVDYVYQQFNGGRNYFGVVDDEGTVNSNIVLNQNDTNDTVVYEGLSADVDETSGGTLTTPIACLGDVTTVS